MYCIVSLNYIISYHIISYRIDYIILYFVILYYIILYFVMLYYIILYCLILYYIIVYYIILYYMILYYIIYTYIYIHTTLDYTLSHGKFCEMAIPSIKHGMLKDVAPTSSHVPPAAVTRASNLLRSMAFSYVEHQGRIIPVGWVNRIFKNRLSQPSLHWDCLKKLFLTPQTLCCLLMVF